jgi:hypothetical protein
MTQTALRARIRHTLTAALLIATMLTGAVIAATLMPAPAHAATTLDPSPGGSTADIGPDPFFLAQFAPGTDLSDAQRAYLIETAHRVCEGYADGMTATAMIDTLDGQGFTRDEARRMVLLAGIYYCP